MNDYAILTPHVQSKGTKHLIRMKHANLKLVFSQMGMKVTEIHLKAMIRHFSKTILTERF